MGRTYLTPSQQKKLNKRIVKMEDIYEGPAELPGHPPKIIKKKFESDIS